MGFVYTGTTSQSIAVTSTLGLAAQIAQIASDASSSSGSLQTLINDLQTQDNTMQQKVNDIDSAAATFQTQLQARYAQYQAAIEAANTTLNSLSALLNAKSNN
jgi:flagellar hook-associated protein 2